MASPGVPRRRPNGRRQALSRTNTLFGAIKNIVTAPLSWFASTDDFEDSRDSTGKRRRLAAVPTEPALDEEEQRPRTKRMRVGSPTRQLRLEGAYLDPPDGAFDPPATGNYVRSTLSPLRNLSISRTMSIDPPPRSQSHDLQSQRPLDTDSSMESVHPTLTVPSLPRVSHSVPRDLSRPYSRPPFRMRTSLTPQRERSEPPPLHQLRTHPTFVKPPPLDEVPCATSIEPGPTLGSLVDSVRRTESPARSLLFGGKHQAEPKPDMSRVQKALHELEIYKTPLLPTRLRSTSTQASMTGVPDLFRSRPKIVLMKDEGRAFDRKLGRKESVSPGKNGTKPYAGEGGMKRMLAKRKMELEEEEKGEEVITKVERAKGKEEDEAMEEDKTEPLPSLPPKEVPTPSKDDWYSLASGPSASTGGSSLRVGRAKSSRNHIVRPTARSRAKFSAAFEEEGDEAMLDEEKEREKEELEAAAKKAPEFKIPEGFSFAKDVKPIEHDVTKAKEPPIKSLPFSFGAPAAPVAQAAPIQEKVEVPAPAPQPSQPPPTTTLPFSFGTPPAAPEKPMSLFGPPPTISVPSQPSEAPNAKGPPLGLGPQPTEPPKVEVTAPSPAPPSPAFTLGSPSGGPPPPTAPAKEAEKKEQSPAVPILIFGGAAQEKLVKEGQAPAPTPSIFSESAKAAVPPLALTKPAEGAEAAKSSPFTFGAPSTTPATSVFGAKPADKGSPNSAPSLFGAQPKATTTTPRTTGFAPSTGGSLFGGPAAADTSKPATPLFGTTEKSKAETEKPATGFGASTAPSTTFTFSQLSTTTAIEAPVPMALNGPASFGGIAPPEQKAPSPTQFTFGAGSKSNSTEAKPASPTPFAFGAPDKEKKASSSPAPFTFGAPSTPKAPEKTTPFAFGTPSASPAPSPVFGFGGVGGSTTGDISKPLQVERPVTPPKQAEEEVKMEESPTREVQQANKLNFTGFSFGTPPTTGSVLFGGPTSAPPATTTPFPFGGASSGPFGAPPMKESKSEGPKPFTFHQSSSPVPPTGTGFTFGQTTQTAESPRPSTTGSYGFSPSTPASTTTGFTFGAAQPTSNVFGQQQSGGSAPSSPSTFQATFNFGGTSSGTGTGFGFGSQPASPATGTSNLPQTPFGGGTTGFGSSAPSSPFSAPIQITPSTSSGGTLFTIGAPPPPQPGGTQGRAIKKLPNRSRIKR